MSFHFSTSFRNWSRIPIDDFDYLSADELLGIHQEQLRELVELAQAFRWSTNHWRNRDGSLEAFMREVPDLGDKAGLDFGCGLGLDAAKWLQIGLKEVSLADLHPKLLLVAQRVLTLQGRIARRLIITRPEPPWFECKVDVFWSMGVLHHTPNIAGYLEQACKCLNPGGECRVLLYSDVRWKEMTGSEPDGSSPVHLHPKFHEFVARCDSTGNYADWYDADKISKVVEPFGVVADCRHLCDRQFIGVVVKPK